MEGPISSRNQDRQGTTGNQETTPPLSPWPGPFVVSEYVALPGDRIAFAAMDPATGIMCPGRDNRSLAECDAQALNAAYQLARRSLVATRVTRPAAPVGRNPDACTNELHTAIENAGGEA